MALAVLVTYVRLPVAELYHVSNEGIAGGLSRVLVLSNFPLSLGGIALALVAADRLPGRAARALAAVSVALCAVTAWPGVVDQADLDAKPVNALPAAGLALALGLGLAAVRRGGVAPSRLRRGDVVLLAATALLLARALPALASVRLRSGLAALLALMLAYGLTNAVEDGWHEQVVKRGWADWRIPDALVPGARPVWGFILAAAALLWLVWLRRAARRAV
jgi:hypothetical protein